MNGYLRIKKGIDSILIALIYTIHNLIRIRCKIIS